MTPPGVTSPCNETGTCGEIGDTGTAVWETLMAVYLGAILLLSLAFNGTLCLVFIKKPHLLSISNCFVLNLACCHLCMSVFVLPFSLLAVVSQGSWIYGGPWCEFQGFFFTIVIVTMQFALLIVSIDRNYAIMNSLRYPNVFTPSLCSLLIGGSWVIAIVLSIPPLLHSKAGEYKFHPHQFLCTLDWSSKSAYLIVFSVLTFAVPILCQSFCYIKIFKAAIGHSKRNSRIHPFPGQHSHTVRIDPPTMSTDSVTGPETEYVRRTTTAGCKAVRTIFIIALTYSICWVPYLIDCFLTYNCGIRIPNLSAAALCFVFSTGILNPIIYGYMNGVIRREIGRFLCGNPSLNDTEDIVSTSMSTFSSARKTTSSVWVTQQSAGVSRSHVNGEMGTIEEEAEDNGAVGAVQTEPNQLNDGLTTRDESCSNCEPVVDSRVSQQPSPRGARDTSTPSDQDGHPNYFEKRKTEVECDRYDVMNKVTSQMSKSASAGKEINISTFSKTETFAGERRRFSASEGEEYFSKGRRKKKRDCGSFLYFDSNKIPRPKSEGRRKRRRERWSVDHVQSISLAPVPKQFNFRFSLTGEERSAETLTLRSDVKIRNHSFTRDAGSSHNTAATGTSCVRVEP